MDELKFDSAEKFLDQLSPHCEDLWGDSWTNEWIFRGQWDSEWPLLSSIWRNDIEKKYRYLYEHYRGNNHINYQTILDEIFTSTNPTININVKNLSLKIKDCSLLVKHMIHSIIEQRVVLEFHELTNDLGFVTDYRSEFKNPECFLKSVWLNLLVNSEGEPEPIGASIAQHHGIATRFLDWTKNAHKAAFFAIEGKQEGEHDPETLAVYALNRTHLTSEAHSTDKHTISFIDIPRYKNEFLHAQDGLFTKITNADRWFIDNDGKWPSIETVIEKKHGKDITHIFKKVELNISEVGKLRKLLSKGRITKAHLMPTRDNVTSTLMSKWDSQY